MKMIKSLAFITLVTCSLVSCSKKNGNDVEVYVAEENEMNNGEKLTIEVVNEIDPICGMDTASHLKDTAEYKGKTYGFCSSMCKEKFLESPEEYANK